MILIRKGETNKIVVTLSELTTIAPPYYLFRVVDDIDKTEYAFVLEDISIYGQRYNEFELIEGETVEFENLGFYHYYIYEQDNNTNLDYTLAGGLVELGKLKVVGATTNPTQSFNATDEYKSFNG